MSCYDKESGDIVIPVKEWAAFRTALITEWNKLQNNLYDEACKTFSTLKEKYKGKRNVNWREVVSEYINSHDDYYKALAVADLILTDKYGFVSPKMKDLKIYPTSKSVALSIQERADVYIRLSNESHTISYGVEENNHACRDAHDLPIVIYMFNLLSKITWTKNSGGVILGNDEYAQESYCFLDSSCEGYTVFSFGPRGR